MPKKLAIKDTQKELKLFYKRVSIVAILIGILIGVLILRLVQLQIFDHDIYTTLSNQNQLSLIPIEPARGIIYDRNGVVLAANSPIFSLDIIPEKVANLSDTIARLQTIIPLDKNDIADFYKEMGQKRRYDAVPIKVKLTEDEIAKFAVNQWRFPGVAINARLIRYYPYGSNLAHVIGYMGRINEEELDQVDQANYSATNYIGKMGIEKYYENDLHGQVGAQQVETDASGRVVRVLGRTAPVPGNNIYLTIDNGLQTATYQALHDLGDQAGAVVAIDPQTGEILAMASNPSYDPNLFVQGISAAAFKALQSQPKRPLYNRTIRGLFAPGSTIKPFMALQGLANNIVDAKYSIRDPGFFVFGNHTYRDHTKGGHGNVNLEKAIMVSCDTYFFNLALKSGITRIDDNLFAFGFGQPSHIEMQEELGGLVPTPEWKSRVKHSDWFMGDTIVVGIGQGYLLATPLQLASGVATLAEQGKRMQPHLTLKTQLANGQIIPHEPSELPGVDAPDTAWKLVQAGMMDVLGPGGTGYRFGKAPYTVAAKTGTAQVFNLRGKQQSKNLPELLRDNSLFIAYAPVNKPLIAVAVVAEHTTNAPIIARKVMDYYLLTEHHLPVAPVPPTAPPPPKK